MSAVPFSKKLVGVGVVVVGVVVLWLGPEQYLHLDYVQGQLGRLVEWREERPVMAVAVYTGVYVMVTAASIPGALILTLLAGAVFGFLVGSLIVAVAATTGATLAFLLARHLLDDWVQTRMGERLARVREKFREEGALYLFSIRLVPVFPFFAVNLVMGLTSIRVSAYVMASFLGMLVPSMVFVNAGTQLAQLESVEGLLSGPVLASFGLLAVFPYFARWFVRRLRRWGERRR